MMLLKRTGFKWVDIPRSCLLVHSCFSMFTLCSKSRFLFAEYRQWQQFFTVIAVKTAVNFEPFSFLLIRYVLTWQAFIDLLSWLAIGETGIDEHLEAWGAKRLIWPFLTTLGVYTNYCTVSVMNGYTINLCHTPLLFFSLAFVAIVAISLYKWLAMMKKSNMITTIKMITPKLNLITLLINWTFFSPKGRNSPDRLGSSCGSLVVICYSSITIF